MRRLGQKTVDLFCEVFPFWAQKIERWERAGFHKVRIYLTDGNAFLFIRKNKYVRLIGLTNGRYIYDSYLDSREGL